MNKSQVPQRLFDALDKGDVGTFLRFWAALPKEGRLHHPMGPFVYAALMELADQRMTGAQRFASDQRDCAQTHAPTEFL